MASIYDYESNLQPGDMPYDQAEQADQPSGVVPSTDSPLTGHRCQVGRAGNHPVFASEHEDGTWSWNGFSYASFDAARISARAAGY